MNERRLRLKGKVAIVTGAGSRGEGVGNGKANLSETLPFNPQVVGSIPTGPTKLIPDLDSVNHSMIVNQAT